MFISDVYLENYSRLMEGLNRNEIEINFLPAYEAGLNKIFFFGRNGSGKSTLINALSPFTNNNDGREMFPIGKNGRKVITYRVGDKSICCDIQTTSKGKNICSVYIDGEIVESTKKGGVNEYLHVVKQELGITPDYLKLGRVGNRVNNFLDLGPTERKKFIGSFMPEIEEWITMFKNINRKLLSLKSNLSGIKIELDKYEDKEKLTRQISSLTTSKNLVSKEIDDLIISIAQSEVTLDKLENELTNLGGLYGLSEEDLNNFKNNFKIYVSRQKELEGELEAIFEKKPTLRKILDKEFYDVTKENLNKAITEIGANLANTESILVENTDKLVKLKREKELKEGKLEGINKYSQDDLVKTQEIIDRLSEEYENYSQICKDIPVELNAYTDYSTANKLFDIVEELKEYIGNVSSMFLSREAMDIAKYHDFNADDVAARYDADTSNYDHLKESIEKKRKILVHSESQARIASSFKQAHCRDPECPFEKIIKNYASSEEENRKIKDSLNKLLERLNSIESLKSEKPHTVAACRQALSLYKKLKSENFSSILELLKIEKYFKSTAAFAVLIESYEYKEILNLNSFNRMLNNKRLMSETEEKLKNAKERLENIRDNINMKTDIEASIQDLQSEIDQLKFKVESNRVFIEENTKAHKTKTNTLNVISSIRLQIDQKTEAETYIAKLSDFKEVSNNLIEQISSLNSDIKTNKEILVKKNKERDKVETELKVVESKLNLRLSYEERLEDCKGKIDKGEILAASCHPAKGIPVTYIKNFLEKTQNEVNRLLELALGDMKLKFEVNDNEFCITIYKASGAILKDATEASDGQLSLIKTAVCVALIKQLVGESGYNIVTLDEVDQTLDVEKNKEKFIEIVESLSKELLIQQTFIISHNECFHSSSGGLILLPGHCMPITEPSFMSNKIILADFS